MPLTPSTQPRKRLHTRRIGYEGWQRDDGLFDIEAHLFDVKDDEYMLASGLRRAGEPIHDMWARVTIDRHYVVRALEAEIDGVPYPDGCEKIAPAYAKLVGANLIHGFRKVLFDAMGGVRGCSHLTELLSYLPSAALQTFATLKRDFDPHGEKPFQLSRCHALETSTETVRRYYPKWYRGAA